MTIADRAGTQQITFLDTRDLSRTSDFYERITYHVSGSAYLGFCQRPDAPAEPRGITLKIVTDDVDDVCARLKREGVEFVKEPAGYLIEIQRFWEPLV